MGKHGVQAVFSDRLDGVSKGDFSSLNLGEGLGDDNLHVQHNLKTLCMQAKLPLPHQCQQVHGQNSLWCEGSGELHAKQADILLSSHSNVALAVRTADCLPILLADKQAGIISAVHAGWRGTVARVVVTAVDAMCEQGAKPKRILASFGPCIGACCFEVSQDTGDALSKSCGENVLQHKDGKLLANLAQANQQQLLHVGLQTKHIEFMDRCTFCDPSSRYFSYRRDCGKTGRHLAVIHLP